MCCLKNQEELILLFCKTPEHTTNFVSGVSQLIVNSRLLQLISDSIAVGPNSALNFAIVT